MSDPDHEKEFEAYLARRSSMRSRLHEHESLEPPDELDRIVIAQAHEAIRMRRQPAFFTTSRWALPMGLAATVVLSFTILLHFGLIPKPGGQSKPPIETTLMDEATEEASQAEAVSTPAPAANVPPPPEVRIAAPQSAGEREIAEPASREGSQSERRIHLEQALARAKRETPVASASAPVAAAPAADAAPKDPAEWLKRIQTLRAQGRTEEAESEWQAFRKAWPDYPVPEDPNP